MLVYRITTVEWSDKLTASGFPARWNGRGRFVLYTQSSMTLAYLENVVHRSGEGLHELFKIMVIEVPDNLEIHELKLKDLPPNWDNYTSYSTTQSIGNKWIANLETPILKVPSAVIPQESNYLFNLAHPDYYRLKLIKTEPFTFDLRINESDSSIPHSKIDSERKFPLHDYRFDVAVSFAGEDRVYVERVVANLKVNNIKVFYDKDYQAELWGKDLYQHLNVIYQNQARFCLVFVSKSYAQKLWTKHEFKSAQSRAFTNESEYILPLRLDDTKLPGLNPTTGYLDTRFLSINEITEIIAQKVFA